MRHQTYHLSQAVAVLFFSMVLTSSPQATDWHVVETITKGPPSFQYGESVAVSRDGKLAAVTQALEPCPDGTPGCGAVYIYVQDNGRWSQQAKLFASDAIENTLLGGYDFYDRTVALDDDGAVLAVATNPAGLGKGAVYVFTRIGAVWNEQKKLILPTALLPAPQVCEQDTFGQSVALSGDGDVLVVGAGNECLELNTGAAYVFTHAGTEWAAQTRLVGSRAEPLDAPNLGFLSARGSTFGYSVDISGDGNSLVIGSPGSRSDLKQAYIFSKQVGGAWLERAVLQPADKPGGSAFFGDFGEYYGFSVALNRIGNVALVGDYRGGSAYLYKRAGNDGNSWEQEAKLGANITQHSSIFGFSVDLSESGAKAIVGDWGAGTTFLFSKVRTNMWSPRLIDTLGGGNGSSVTISGDGATLLVSGPGRFTTLHK